MGCVNNTPQSTFATFDLKVEIWYAQISMRYPWLPALGLMGIGIYIAGAIVLGIVGGHWLDQKLNTGPLWLIIGLILGLAVAVLGVYNMLKPFMKNNKKDKGSK